MASLLVTGGAGFIGANFARYWLHRHPGDRLVVLDALTYAGNRANLEPLEKTTDLLFVEGDIRDRELVERLLRDEDLATIVHFAAESHVDRSITGPDVFLDVNVVGTHQLLKAARATWLESDRPVPKHRFHHVSTDEVYGELEVGDPAFTESTPYRPNSPYAASKAASDHLVRAYHRTYGLLTSISNCSNNYGPYQFPEKLIPLCLLNLLDGKELPIYGDGANIRDWLFVQDHCAGIERVLQEGQPGRTYNLGGDCERTNLELVGALCQQLDRRFAEEPGLASRYPRALAAAGRASEEAISFVRDRPGHDRRYAIDASRARAELGFEPATTLETGLATTIDWYLSHSNWWQSGPDPTYTAG